jgi:acyl-CoA oxidase
LFANPTGKEHLQIRSFCAAKTIVTWHLEKMATICRERTGGGSFLLNSAIPQGIISSHSGMTAEGDNRVLMQKVVKDILSDTQKERHDLPKLTQCPIRQIPKFDSVATFETLRNLIFFREHAEIKLMSEAL